MEIIWAEEAVFKVVNRQIRMRKVVKLKSTLVI